MTDFVTGATGCIGRHLVAELRRAGRRLVCTVQHAAEADDPLFRDPDVRAVHCDLSRPGWEDAVSGEIGSCENVFHLAGEMPHRPTCRGDRRVLEAVNVTATEKLFRLAAPCRRFLFASSISIYGDSFESPKDEEGALAPSDFYAETKRRAEETLRRAPAGPARLILRPGIVYGAYDTNVIGRLTDMVRRGWMVLPGGGTAVRTLSAAPLVAETFRALSEREPMNGVFNVADPASPPLRQLVEDVARLLGARAPRRVPAALCVPPAAVFSLLQAVGVRNRLHLGNLRRLTTSNPVDCRRLRDLMGPPRDHYREALAADVRWTLERGA